jgi:hypothetical protein
MYVVESADAPTRAYTSRMIYWIVSIFKIIQTYNENQMKSRSNMEFSNRKVHTYGGLLVYLQSIPCATLILIE